MTSTMSSSSVQVIVRLRPMNEKEKRHGTLPVITASTQDKTVTVIKGQGLRQARSSFSFDHVFTAFSSQEEVFEETLKSVVGEVLKGYESTVFAYGQTGTGKTYTMEGDLSSPEMQGVIPRSARAIFEALQQPNYSDFSVSCSYLEIYNEELCDLLLDDAQKVSERKGNTKLEIMDGKKGTFCRGLTQREVKTPEDVLILMQNAQNQRKIGETKMNKNSSRSHCIFTLTVNAKSTLGDGGVFDFTGKLHMVDLAGSECAKTASLDKSNGSEASRERERMNINRSLLTLGRVISLLKEQTTNKRNNIRIPYRDSKLTRILQESLGGRCKTVVIATLSPSVTAIEESISTLNYAQSASGIINKPIATSYLSVAPKASVYKLNCSMVEDASSGEKNNSIEYWNEMECRLQYMQAQVEEAQAALARKHMQQQELVERAEKAESEKFIVDKQLHEAKLDISALNEKLNLIDLKQKQTEADLLRCQTLLNNTREVLKATQNTEKSLTCEANALIQVLKGAIAEGERLYDLVRKNYESELCRREASKHLESNTSLNLDKNLSMTSKISENVSLQLIEISELYDNNVLQENQSLKEFHLIFSSVVEQIKKIASSIGKDADEVVLNITTSEDMMTKAISSIEKTINDSDQTFLQLFENSKESLQRNQSILEELGNSHKERAKQSLVSLEENIMKSESYVSNMLENALEALNEGQNESKGVRAKHSELVNRWKSYSMKNLTDLKSALGSEYSALCESKKIFSNDLKHYDAIRSCLDDQRETIHNEGIVQKKEIKSQALEVNKHDKLIVDEKNSILMTQKMVMENLLHGFQEMLQSEMRKLSEKAEDTHVRLLSSSGNVQRSNKSIEKRTLEIFSKVDETNVDLKQHVDAALANDHNFLNVIDKTSEKLQEIELQTNEHQHQVQTFGQEAHDDMKKFAHLDNSTSKSLEAIQKDGECCVEHLRQKMQNETNLDISDLLGYGEEFVTHTKDVLISETSSLLDEMLKPRNEVLKKIENGFNSMTTMFSRSNEEVAHIVDAQRGSINEAMVFASDHEDKCRGKLADERKKQIDLTKEKMEKSIGKMRIETQRDLERCSELTKDVKQKVGRFAQVVMNNKEDVPALCEKRNFSFSEHLSSTKFVDKSQRLKLSIGTASENISPGTTTASTHFDKENHENGIHRYSGEIDSTSVKSGYSNLTALSPRSPNSLESGNEDDKIRRNFYFGNLSTKKKRSTVSKSEKKPTSGRTIGSTPTGNKSLRKKKKAPTPIRGNMKRLRETERASR